MLRYDTLCNISRVTENICDCWHMPELRPMITVEELAAQLRVARETARRKCRDREIEGAVRVGRRWLIPADTIAEMLGVKA